MKLFGNKRNAAMLGKREGASPSGSTGKRRLTGLQRGLILLAVCLVVLAGSVVAVYKTFVKPMEIKQPEPTPVVVPEIEEEAEEVTQFVPPVTIKEETKVDEETGEETTVEVEIPASHKEGFYNILIVGTDDDGTRTDTIMIGRLDVKEHTVALMSIPRDTLISGNYTVPKINGVYGSAGRGENGIAALKSKLAQLLGFEVDGYAMVNLDAFVELVDLVGGVKFNVPQRMYYSDPSQDLYIDLQPGLQHLDGEKAMGLVRFRKGYASQDIQRTKVQQQFLQALAKKCLAISNLRKIDDMADIFLKHVTTDLTLGNLVYFGKELLKCDIEKMYSYTLEGEAVMVGDASCYAVYLNKTLQAVNGYFNPYDAEITSSNVTIRTPEQVRAEQAALEAEREQQEEETLPEEELPEEAWPWEEPETELPEWEDWWTEEEPEYDWDFPEESPFPDWETPEETIPEDEWVEVGPTDPELPDLIEP